MKKFLILFLLLFSLVGCTKNKYEVKFMNENEEYKIISVTQNKTVTKPANPIKTDYTFCYWSIIEDGIKKEFDFTNKINSNIVLYANFIYNPNNLEVYKVEFVSNNENLIENQYVLHNTRLNKPEDPNKKGYLFGGWYEDSNFTKEANLSERIKTNKIFYAKWLTEEDIDMDAYKKEIITKINQYTANNNYAYHMLDRVKTLINEAENTLSGLNKFDEISDLYNKTIVELDEMNISNYPSYGIQGDIIQPVFFLNYSVSQFESHFKKLLNACIDKVIVQWTYDTTGDGTIYYNSSVFDAKTKYSSMLENLLKAAENTGIKVFVGLNSDDSWWDTKNAASSTYQQEQALIGTKQAKELYDLYKEKYPNAFYGWYFAYEFYCVNPLYAIGFGTSFDQLNLNWCNMLNTYLDALTLIDDSMPLMLSPYYSDYYGGSKTQTYNQWKYFFENTRFRKNDIIAPQDSFGLFGKTIDDDTKKQKVEDYIEAFYEASKANTNVEFWLNIELFGRDSNSNLFTCDMDRVKYQIEYAKNYTSNLICFSYTHYFIGKTNNNLYIDYLKTLTE